MLTQIQNELYFDFEHYAQVMKARAKGKMPFLRIPHEQLLKLTTEASADNAVQQLIDEINFKPKTIKTNG